MKSKEVVLPEKGIDFSRTKINLENIQTPEQKEYAKDLIEQIEITKIEKILLENRLDLSELELKKAINKGKVSMLNKHPESYDNLLDQALRSHFEALLKKLPTGNEATNNKKESAIDITEMQNDNDNDNKENEPQQIIEEEIKPKTQGKT